MALSQMQSSKFIYGLVITLLLCGSVSADSWQQVWGKYRSGKDVREELSAKSAVMEDDQYYLTLSAVYESDGEKALELYKRALRRARNGELKKFLRDKIADYYYAGGYYVTAAKFRNGDKQSSEVSGKEENIAESKDQYFIQYGVFSTRENAKKFIGSLQRTGINFILVVHKERFHVVSGPYNGKAEAARQLAAIESRFGQLKPFIKKF